MANNTIDMKFHEPVERLTITTDAGSVTNDVALVYVDTLTKEQLFLALRKLEQKILNDHAQA